MISLSRFTKTGTSVYTKPVYILSSLILTLAVVFTTLIISGCTSSAPTVRKFYIVSLRYEDSNTSDLVGNVADFLKKDDGGVERLNTLRVGYRGVCVEGSMEDSNSQNSSTTSPQSWTCTRHPGDLPHLTHDPLNLYTLSNILLTRITFSTPLWVALACLATGWLALLPNTLSLPFIPPPHIITRKIAAASSALGSLFLLGLLMLHQVTISSVTELVIKLTMGVVNADAGTAIPAFGWSAFALASVAAAGLTALLVAEMAVESAKRRAEECLEAGLAKAGVDKEMLRGFRASAGKVEQPSNGDGENFSRLKAGGLSLATQLCHKGMEARAGK